MDATPAGPRRALSRRAAPVVAAAGGALRVPPELDAGHVYHLFPVLSPRSRRAAGPASPTRGIETLIHYPVPIPRQPALATEDPAECPVADRVCGEVLSLPLYPDLPETAVTTVVEALAASRQAR